MSTQRNAKVLHQDKLQNQSQQQMYNKMNQLSQPEIYIEAGQVKLRFKHSITKDMFPEEAQEMAEVIYRLNDTNTPELKSRGIKNSRK